MHTSKRSDKKIYMAKIKRNTTSGWVVEIKKEIRVHNVMWIAVPMKYRPSRGVEDEMGVELTSDTRHVNGGSRHTGGSNLSPITPVLSQRGVEK